MSRCPGLARDIQAAQAHQAAAQAAGSAGFRVPRALSSEASDGIRRSSRGGGGGGGPPPPAAATAPGWHGTQAISRT